MSIPRVPEDDKRTGFFSWIWRRPRRWFLLGIPFGGLVAFVVGAAFTGGFFSAMKITETNAFCTSCHEMDTAYQEYTHSVHFSNAFGIRATCGNCHVPPAFLPGLWRHMKASLEVWGHLTGEINTPAKFEAHRLALAQAVWAELKNNDSAECRNCHNAAAMAYDKQPAMAARAHGELATSGKTCIDCHKGPAHNLPAGS